MAIQPSHIGNPTEDQALLSNAIRKESPATSSRRRSSSPPSQNYFKLTFFFGGIILVGIIFIFTSIILEKKRSQFHSIHQETNASSNDYHPWWDSQSGVETSETFLPGLLPTMDSSSSSLRYQNEGKRLRWGIVGLGRIARDFATALKMTGASITAVAAGSLPNTTARAQEFANIYSVPQSYGTYEDLAEDPNVDIVYVANTNQLHFNTTMLMLQAGKNVLLEKPMTMNYEEATALAAAAKKAKRLLLTNFWTRFFPIIKYVRSTLASDRLGSISAMRGDFGFPTPPNGKDRFLNRTAGGGTMLDVGCYLVNIAVMVASSPNIISHGDNIPSQVQATAQTTYMGADYGVDTEISFAVNWDSSPSRKRGDFILTGQASFRRPSSFEVEIEFTHGRIVIHGPANAATAATVYEYEPYGPLRRVEMVRSEMPLFDQSFGPKEYPRGEGFVYIIHDIEQCMQNNGIPGVESEQSRQSGGCLELDALTMDDQLTTVRITDTVMTKAGYWEW